MLVSESFKRVVEMLRLEASAIERTASVLDAVSVESALKLLLECTGKIVVLGVGKSGIIANKIADTMTSTGSVAVFLHPSDALHGGLGVVSPGDCLILLSNSGETDELLSLLPSIRARNVRTIAIVGNTASTIARNCEVVLDASVDQEACPLNLAPTTSTTVALAIGDALAMQLMQLRALTASDFAANHPAGRLGKRLTLRVSDLMHPSPSVAPEDGWLEVVRAISKFGLGAVNVTSRDGALIGIVTDGDLRRTIERTPTDKLDSLSAEAMMTKAPVTVNPEVLAFDALATMENRSSQISVLPVVDDAGHAVGLIRLHDVVRSGL